MADAQIPQRTLTHSSHTVIQEEPKPSLLSNILAIVGFIILITIVIWGLVHLAGISRGWFSSLFGNKAATAISVTAPATTTSGAPFTVSWKYNEPTKGTYAFLYQCRSGLRFQTGSMGIPCGVAFTIPSEKKELSLTPVFSGSSALSVPLSIIFMPSASGTQAQGSANTTVVPGQAPVIPTPVPAPPPAGGPAPTPTPAPAPPLTPVSPADISVRVTSVNTDASGMTAVSFDITNVGGSASGSYYFTANLPTQSGYTYTSPAQASLAPGSHIANTLRFTQAVSGVFSVSVNASDANQGNNYASQSVSAPYYNNYNSYNYNNTSPFAPGYGGTQYNSYNYNYPYNQYPYSQTAGYPYYQQQPYSTYYPYAY